MKTHTALPFATAIAFVVCLMMPLKAQAYEATPSGLKHSTQAVTTTLNFYAPTIVRVLKYPENTTFTKESVSVIKKPEQVQVTQQRKGDVITLKSSHLTVEYNLTTGKVAFLDTKGRPLLTEKDHGVQFTNQYDGQRSSFLARQAFLLDQDEPIYGLGQQQNGRLNQRYQRNNLKNENMKVSIPFFQSLKGYGLFWDNYAATLFTDNRQETSFESLGDCSDYYFMYGENPEGVIAQLRDLTGQVPMLPLWGFGYLQSRERYRTQDETVGVVEKYRSLGIPLDGIIQDWQYWGKDSVWNAMSFDPRTFPDPQGMVDKIHALNAKLMIVAWPGFGPQTNQYKEFLGKKMLINFDTWPPNSGTKPYDVYNPEARSIYWSYLNKGVFSLNPDAWWLDSTEPDHINVKDADFDQPTHLGAYRSVVNAFPLLHIKGVYDNQRATTAAKRVFILTRSAFAGQQRYGANTWSGDIVASWETLQKQLPAALNLVLTGNPYWNSDIGGFFLWNYQGRRALQNNAYRELYVRWMQFGAFSPMMRSHGTDAPREIYQFGERGTREFDAIEKAIKLRYSLLPYIYSASAEVSHTAGSIMRPLLMDYTDDTMTHDLNDEFLFGKSLLVAPVVQPMYVSRQDGKGTESYGEIKQRKVYLPKGADWYDFENHQKHSGGQTIVREAPIDYIPLFVKAGSIIPFGPEVQYAEQKRWDNLQFTIYPGADATFCLYEDENDNYNYEKGAFSLITFTWNEKAQRLTISSREGRFENMLQKRTFIVRVAGKDKQHRIRYTGKPMTLHL